MYIRASDKDNITKYDSFFNFLNAKRRKGHQIIKFKIKKNDFEYFEDELELKYIGKNELALFKQVPVHFITTKTSSLVFQALDIPKLHFLTIDDDSGAICKVQFSELEEGMDIILYDPNTKDYVIDELLTIVSLIPQIEVDKRTLEYKVFNMEEQKLSRYILSLESNNGMIINNFMIM